MSITCGAAGPNTSTAFRHTTQPTGLDRHDPRFVADFCEQQDISDQLDRLFEVDRSALDVYELDAHEAEILELITRATMLRYRRPAWAELSGAFARYGRLLLVYVGSHHEILGDLPY